MVEVDAERAHLLEQAAGETIEIQHICRNTESIDAEIIKCIQRQHAMDCMLIGMRKEFEEVDFELQQELLSARNDLVREHESLLVEKEEVLNNQRAIEQLREIDENLTKRTKDFEKMRARHLCRLQANLGEKSDHRKSWKGS